MAELQDVDQPAEVIAAILNVSKSRIRQLVRDGLPKSGRNAYPMIACIRWYINYWKKKAVSGEDDLLKHKKRLLIAQAEKAQIEVKEKKQILIHIDDVTKQSARNMLTIRNRFLAMPPRLAQMLETTSTYAERLTMIDKEVKTALESLADGSNRA